MAETIGIYKSQISRETIETGERPPKNQAERDISKPEILDI